MLVALRPTNMDRERDKFFQSHYTYNPQFEYQEPMPMAVLEKYCEASGQFIHQVSPACPPHPGPDHPRGLASPANVALCAGSWHH